jgi:RNA polymerase sigma-70 factor (ECF subfamily)
MASDPPFSLADLLRRCVQGDPAAWEEFFARYHNYPIARTVIRTAGQWGVKEKADFDDLTQEFYEKLWTARQRILGNQTFVNELAFIGYLAKVATNLVHDSMKSRRAGKRGSGKAGDPLPEDATGDSRRFGGAAHMEKQVLLGQAYDFLESGGLSDRDLAVFEMHYRDGMTAAEIAAVPAVGLSTKGVESLLYRMKEYLREKMASPPEWDGNEPDGDEGGTDGGNQGGPVDGPVDGKDSGNDDAGRGKEF